MWGHIHTQCRDHVIEREVLEKLTPGLCLLWPCNLVKDDPHICTQQASPSLSLSFGTVQRILYKVSSSEADRKLGTPYLSWSILKIVNMQMLHVTYTGVRARWTPKVWRMPIQKMRPEYHFWCFNCLRTAPSQGHSMQKQFCPKSSSRSAVSVQSLPPRKTSFPRQSQSHETRAVTQYHEAQRVRLAPPTVQFWLCTCMWLLTPPLKDKLVKKEVFSYPRPHQSCDFTAENKIPKDE